MVGLRRAGLARDGVVVLVLLAGMLQWLAPPVSASCLNGNCAVFTANVAGSGSGVITSSGDAIHCTYANGATTGTCSANLAIPVTTRSVTLDLTATPAAGSYACTVVGCGTAGQAMTFTTSFVNDETLPFSFIATKRVLSVAIGGDGAGAVHSSDAAINCPNACSAQFNYGSVVTLTASAKTGTFAGWGGACSGQGATCVVTMTDDREHGDANLEIDAQAGAPHAGDGRRFRSDADRFGRARGDVAIGRPVRARGDGHAGVPRNRCRARGDRDAGGVRAGGRRPDALELGRNSMAADHRRPGYRGRRRQPAGLPGPPSATALTCWFRPVLANPRARRSMA
jgi:hypothetical protein